MKTKNLIDIIKKGIRSFGAKNREETKTVTLINQPEVLDISERQRLDSILNGFKYDKITPGNKYHIRSVGINSDLDGDWSTYNTFTTLGKTLNPQNKNADPVEMPKSFGIKGTSDYYHSNFMKLSYGGEEFTLKCPYTTDEERIIDYKGMKILALLETKTIDCPENKDPDKRTLIPGIITDWKYRIAKDQGDVPVTRIRKIYDLADKCDIRNMLYKEGYPQVIFWGDSDR